MQLQHQGFWRGMLNPRTEDIYPESFIRWTFPYRSWLSSSAHQYAVEMLQQSFHQGLFLDSSQPPSLQRFTLTKWISCIPHNHARHGSSLTVSWWPPSSCLSSTGNNCCQQCVISSAVLCRRGTSLWAGHGSALRWADCFQFTIHCSCCHHHRDVSPTLHTDVPWGTSVQNNF